MKKLLALATLAVALPSCKHLDCKKEEAREAIPTELRDVSAPSQMGETTGTEVK